MREIWLLHWAEEEFMPIRWRSLWLIILLTGSFCQTNGQEVDTQRVNLLDTALVEFARSAPLQHASWGFCAIDTETGELYRGVNKDLSLMPASTLKPFTSAVALSELGENFRYQTPVTASGMESNQGMIRGNLYIEGSGDPTLGSSRFGLPYSTDTLYARVLESLQRNGIHTVYGSVVADASCCGSFPVISSWQYEDMGNHYGAPVSGLNVYDNNIVFLFEPGKRPGDSAVLVGTRPVAPYMEVWNEVMTGPRGSGDRVNVYGAPFSYLRWLRGTVPAGVKSFEVAGTLPDPEYHLAFELHEFLVDHGIEVVNPPTTKRIMERMGKADTLERQIVCTHFSPPLAEIIYLINFRSVNMYAEAVLRTLGQHVLKEGTTEAGLKAVEQFWNQQGLDLGGMNLKDGSGLSRKNNISPAILAGALAVYTKNPHFQVLYASIPVGGVSGSVSGYFRKSAAEGHLRAKSGTIEKVKAYSGYATNAQGRQIAYSLIVNQYNGSSKELMVEIEKLLVKLCESEE